MKENPCSNQDMHVHMGLNMKILKMSPELFASHNMEGIAYQTDNSADAFVHENVSFMYDILTMLCHHFV